MEHAFSNLIKMLITKLLAYVVSTFCKSIINKATVNQKVNVFLTSHLASMGYAITEATDVTYDRCNPDYRESVVVKRNKADK